MTTTLSPSSHSLHVTGAVIAGGRSSRLGRDKALLQIDGETLLARAVRLVGQVCAETIVVGPRERAGVVPATRVVPDEQPGIGPLGGIASALRATGRQHVLVVATDLPLLSVPLLRHMVALATEADVVIPRVAGRTQQLHAVYSARCLPYIDRQIASGDYKIDRFFPLVRVRELGEDDVQRFDPALHTFLNINTEADWEHVQSLLHR